MRLFALCQSRSPEHNLQALKWSVAPSSSTLPHETAVGDGQVKLLPPRLPEEPDLEFAINAGENELQDDQSTFPLDDLSDVECLFAPFGRPDLDLTPGGEINRPQVRAGAVPHDVPAHGRHVPDLGTGERREGG